MELMFSPGLTEIVIGKEAASGSASPFWTAFVVLASGADGIAGEGAGEGAGVGAGMAVTRG